MLHEGEHTASDMVTKGVLDDRARVVYRGLTDIENGARFTSGFPAGKHDAPQQRRPLGRDSGP